MPCRLGPRSIIVFKELLDDNHWNDKRFVKITRDKIISEIDEVVFRNFGQELNERMAERALLNARPRACLDWHFRFSIVKKEYRLIFLYITGTMWFCSLSQSI